MDISDGPITSPVSRRRLRLPGLAVLIALALIGLKASHQTHILRQKMQEFQGDTVSEPGPDHSMASALKARQSLLSHPTLKLSTTQISQMVTLVNSPVDDVSQSEALDVLSLAQRANELSSAQIRTAQDATLLVLTHSPGMMVRLESARFLGHLGGTRGVFALTALQSDLDPRVRQAAHDSLTQITH
ncbi:MAG: hypothetical protein ACRYFS_17715 [Janthinobacterium lividum]